MKPKPAYIILFFLLTVLSKGLTAQTHNPRYNFKHLTVQTGLAQNIVYHFLQDSRGYMWLGTRNGLSLYDGGRTINFLNDEQVKTSIRSNFITRILEDPLHQVWMGTDAGISRYNRMDNSFSNFSMLTEKGNKEAVFCVPLGFVNDHEMWLLETKTKSIKTYDTHTQVIDSLTATPAVDGTLWYDSVSHTRHIWTYLGSGTIHYTFRGRKLVKKEVFFSGENKEDKAPVLQVIHVLPQNDSTVWLSTTAGLLELNPHTRHYTIYNNRETQPVKELRYTAIAPNGLLWVATGNNGLYTFNLKDKKFIDNYRSYRLDPFSIGSNNIVSLYFDRVGNIWCGSYGQGASYTSVEKAYFQKALGRNELEHWEGNNNVDWIGHDSVGSLWCIMSDAGGLWKLGRDKRIIEQREPVLENGQKFTGRFYKLVFDGNNHAWAVGQEGLFRYNLLTNRLHKMTYPLFSADLFGSNWVQDMIRLNDGSFLFGTFSGLYRITLKNSAYDIQPFSELNKKAFTSFATLYQDDAGTVYVKDLGNYLYVLENSKKRATDTIIHSILFLPQVNQFYEDTATNSILLATSFGLYQLNRNDYSLKKKDLKAPPPFLSISSFIKKGSKLWLFGEKGLYYFDEKKNTGRTFTVEDGLPSNEFNQSSGIFSSDECIAGTTNGLVSFYPDKLQDKLYPPLVQLTNIYVNDSSSGFIPNPQEAAKISLSHNQNTFSFDFAPIAFQNAGACSFEYKLQGYDQGWIRSGEARYTRYSKIPPGNYTFQLRAIDASGTISPHSKTLEIEIHKAFWQTTLFRNALLAVALLGGWLVVKWYLSKKIRKQKRNFEKQQAIEKERTRIATDMHDDLGAGLSRIKYLSESIQAKKRGDETIRSEVEKIAAYSDEMVEKMGEIVWALNEKNDTLADLIAFTRSYAAEYLSNHCIGCIFDAPELLPVAFVTGELRRNIFLSVKESLHNIVKHARAGNVSIGITIDNDLQVAIQDDGVGIDTTCIRPFSNGLANIQKRMEEVGGEARFENSMGTRVTLNVPFHK